MYSMPAADCPQVRHSERLKTSQKLPMAQRPPHARGRGTSTRGTRGRGRATVTTSTAGASIAGDPTKSDNIPGDVVVATSSGVKIRWDNYRTNTLVQFLATHPGDRRILFNEGGKKPDDEPAPSGSDKSKISAVIAHCVFEKDNEYQYLYAEESGKFTQAVGNRLNYLKNKYKRCHGRFNQTGAGVDPLQPGAEKQVISEFPWYEALHELWKNNPAYVPKTFSSALGADRAGDMMALTSKSKGKCKALPPPDPIDPIFELQEEEEQPQGGIALGGQEQHARASAKCPFSSPSPPPTPPPTSRGTFKSHVDWAVNHGSIRPPKPPPFIASSAASSSAQTIMSSLHRSVTLSARQQSGLYKPGQMSSLSNWVQSDVNDVHGQVESLTDRMQYIYTAKAAQSEYKIAKVNSHHQQLEIIFQHEQAELKCSEAAIVHQHSQEAKSLDLQVLEAQAKVHAEKKAALLLEIELMRLKGVQAPMASD
ncbi:hypothetical protein DFH29DRAFT_883298 [Suillus ampliporus]|nr:hypothetical protein DFH29DRAFT_883298 [Suillus ampliporus]